MAAALRIIVSAAALAALSACTSTGSGPAAESVPAAPAPATEGRVLASDFCPSVSMREGTATLREMAGEKLDYQASISGANRDCHVVDGKLEMKIGIAGRVMAGEAARARAVKLPIRIAIVHGADVLYSRLGNVQVEVRPGAPAQSFAYVDDQISIAVPEDKNLLIYAGFDTGKPEKKKR